MASSVLFAPVAYSRYDAEDTLPMKFKRLLEKSPVASMVSGKNIAIKMHVGERISYSTIPPVFVRTLVDYIKDNDGNPFITDHYMAYRQPQQRGYSPDVLGCEVIDDCGFFGKYLYPKTVDYKTFKHVDVAGHIHDADVLIDFSHVKGHGSCGLGGACKNIAMGCVSDRTRSEIHSLEGGISWVESKCTHCEQCIAACNHNANSFEDGKYEVFAHHCTVCQHCVKVCPTGAITLSGRSYQDFQEGMAVCTKAVVDCFAPGNVYYINVLTAITALCDCWGLTTPSLVPDIGIMASSDIVAVERASLDAIKYEDLITVGIPSGMELGKDGHLFERLHGKNPFVQLEKLGKYGLGTQEYTLDTIE